MTDGRALPSPRSGFVADGRPTAQRSAGVADSLSVLASARVPVVPGSGCCFCLDEQPSEIGDLVLRGASVIDSRYVQCVEGIAALFFVFGLLVGRWWWIAAPLVLTLPAAVWLGVHELTDAELYGDGPITSTSFWVFATILSMIAGLLGMAIHQLVLRSMRHHAQSQQR